MKKTFALIGLAALACGCNTTHFSVTNFDEQGRKTKTVEITNRRALWATEGYSASYNTNGATLTASKSSVDKDALAAIVSAAVTAAK